MKELTERQAELHAYLCERWRDPPTVREMAEHMGGIGTNAIIGHLRALAQKGYIEMPDDRRSRGVAILIGPHLDGTEIEIAGRSYRLTLKETAHADAQPKKR